MDTLLTVHSIVRWIIVVVAALTILKFAAGWLMNSPFKGMDRGLAAAFSGLLDLQVLLGLVYFLWNGFAVTGFPGYRWLHAAVMILAAGLGHLPARLKIPGDKQRFAASLGAILGSLVLIYIGVSLLPNGWTR